MVLTPASSVSMDSAQILTTGWWTGSAPTLGSALAGVQGAELQELLARPACWEGQTASSQWTRSRNFASRPRPMRRNLAGHLGDRFPLSHAPERIDFTVQRSTISETTLSMRTTGSTGSRIPLHFPRLKSARTILVAPSVALF